MKALQMTDSIPRYGLSKAGARLRDDVYWGPLGCLRYRDVEPPRLPNDEWVRVRTRYGGICGSDLGTITLHASTSTTVFTSFPFTLGHENVGYVSELGAEVSGFDVGQRVVVNPLLPCATRGFADDPCGPCRRGDVNLCQRFYQGTLAPGMLTGFCRDTGGSWSSEFIAHRSQLLAVPETLTDEEALLAEPFAVSLHAVLRNLPGPDDTVLVIGGGIIGLCAIAALRGLGVRARIVALVRHEFQANAARRLGADVVLGRTRGNALQTKLLKVLGGVALKPVLGPEVIVGGADVVFDCVGTTTSLTDALRYAGSGGRIALIGLAGVPEDIDWTPVWLNELSINGAFTYAQEEFEGETLSTMDLGLRLMAERKVDLGDLVTHRFTLDEYREALTTVTSKRESNVVKAVFEFDPPAVTSSAPAG